MKAIKTKTTFFLLFLAPSLVSANDELYGFHKNANNGTVKTLYCGCQLIDANIIDSKGCGIASPTKHWNVIDSVKWTSIISPKEIALALPNNSCWGASPCYDAVKDKYYIGHQCCLDSNTRYKSIFSDLNNLAPVAGIIENFRSKRIAGDTSSNHTYGTCSITSDATHYDPSLRSLGIEARSRLFLHASYGLKFPSSVLNKAKRDNLSHPPRYIEKEVARQIREYTGVTNKFILSDWKRKEKNPYHNSEVKFMLEQIGDMQKIRK